MSYRGRYGAPRLTREISAAGHRHDEKTVAARLRRQGLVTRAARQLEATTNSNHDFPWRPISWTRTLPPRARTPYSTRLGLKRGIFKYIETYYNVIRRHSALDYISPTAFEAKEVA